MGSQVAPLSKTEVHHVHITHRTVCLCVSQCDHPKWTFGTKTSVPPDPTPVFLQVHVVFILDDQTTFMYPGEPCAAGGSR